MSLSPRLPLPWFLNDYAYSSPPFLLTPCLFPPLIPPSRMINDPKSTQFIAWTELGTSFVVSNVGEFSRSILGSHFKHNNVSFVSVGDDDRLLNFFNVVFKFCASTKYVRVS